MNFTPNPTGTPTPHAPQDSLVLGKALLADVEELLNLYFSIYGPSYPVALGTDSYVMSQTITSPDCLWLVMRDTANNKIVGSVVFEKEPINKIGKIVALVVRPEYRNRHISRTLIQRGTDEFLNGPNAVNSLYTTTRTNSVSVQLLFLKEGFLPLGIFPNAHKLREYESLVFFAKFRPGVLESRSHVPVVPDKLAPLLTTFHEYAQKHGIPSSLPDFSPTRKLPPVSGEELTFEVIDAPHYIQRRFDREVTDAYDRFYPFHTPNLLITSTNGEVEIYAYFSKKDHYCAIIYPNVPFHRLRGRINGLLELLRGIGVSYIETLLSLNHTESLETLQDAQFLPSALYPAMHESHGQHHDFVLMSRSMEPLNFRGMEIAAEFKPYVDQYVNLWKQMHLDTLEVFNAYRS